MADTLAERAVRGRRIKLAYYRDLKNDGDNATYRPGILTGVDPDGVWIRLDGTRYNLRARTDYEGLRYLDQVTSVPELPMGRFQPTLEDLEGEWEGVPICSIGEDGQLIALTSDLPSAVKAMNTYRRDVFGSMYSPKWDTVTADALVAHWAYFEWQPEDSEPPWLVHWTHEGDDQALHLYYLPA